ncbi:MAG: GNAT family N-acetyltransferase [Rhodothermales bacterium]|nr:GNAT family N-acetyltransferase [Rhodothermales bacterium]
MDVLPRISTPPFSAEQEAADLSISTLPINEIDVIWEMNKQIFDDDRIINSFERPDLLMLVAYFEGHPVGFKVGYRENRFVYYSAKGGVLPEFRRRGIARLLMEAMIDRAQDLGYLRFAFDTFPNLHPGMTVLAVNEGFRLVKADYNTAYREYRLRFEKKMNGRVY